MDVFTDLLNTMRLRSHVKFSIELTSPWGVRIPAKDDCATFYAVTRGNCYLEGSSFESPISLMGGDLVMLPRGDAHVLRDHPESSVIPLEEVVRGRGRMEPPQTCHYGGGGSLTIMVAGGFLFEGPVARPFLSMLPPLIHIPGEQGQLVPWLDTTLKWMASEMTTKNPGAQTMVSRLTEMLFIMIVRAYIAESAGRAAHDSAEAGWLRAMLDPHVGRALERIHEEPNHPWTVAELASEVGMSRTAFSLRFSRLTGVPPLAYVTKWRMLKAGDFLRSNSATLSSVAARVGYESEASFSKAFKREMGVAPGAYRKGVSAVCWNPWTSDRALTR